MEWLPMVGVGMFASILSIPYAMLSGSLLSTAMGVFNFFIVIPS
jgi:maltose/moltooligosaccharide transporter